MPAAPPAPPPGTRWRTQPGPGCAAARRPGRTACACGRGGTPGRGSAPRQRRRRRRVGEGRDRRRCSHMAKESNCAALMMYGVVTNGSRYCGQRADTALSAAVRGSGLPSGRWRRWRSAHEIGFKPRQAELVRFDSIRFDPRLREDALPLLPLVLGRARGRDDGQRVDHRVCRLSLSLQRHLCRRAGPEREGEWTRRASCSAAAAAAAGVDGRTRAHLRGGGRVNVNPQPRVQQASQPRAVRQHRGHVVLRPGENVFPLFCVPDGASRAGGPLAGCSPA